MSTTDENVMKKLSKLCLKNKVESLEAPLTGGVHRAETGNIWIIVLISKMRLYMTVFCYVKTKTNRSPNNFSTGQ